MYSAPQIVNGRPRPALVFVASSAKPTFKLTGRLYGVRCFEETGWDWTGSDELRVIGTAWTNGGGGSNPPNGVALKWEGGGFDSQPEDKVRTYPRRVTPPTPLFLAQPVNIDQQVLFTLSLLERDCDDGDTVCRVTEVSIGVGIAVGVVLGTAYLCPPCAAFLTTAAGIGAYAIAASAYVAALYEMSANDAIGTQFFRGTPASMSL